MGNQNKTIINKEENLTSEERMKVEQLFLSVLSEMKKHGLPDVSLLKKAYNFALRMHGDARRKSGEPYITHPLEVAKILAELGHESDMVAEAILHDVIEDCGVTMKELEMQFSPTMADTVNAVSNIKAMLSPDPEISKMDLDDLNDVKLLESIREPHVRKAAYIKIADREHNLKTIGIFPVEQQLAKAAHTRSIIIPLAKKLHIYKLAEVLGTLCLEIENPQVYNEIKSTYKRILDENRDTFMGSNGLIESTKRMVLEDGLCGQYVAALDFTKRCEDSIFNDLSAKLSNIHEVRSEFTKKNVPLYDIYFISKDYYMETPETLFFNFYDKLHASKYRFTITGMDYMDDSGILYYKLNDRYDNQYRLFIQSETEHLEYTHGIIVSDELEDFRKGLMYVNKAEPGAPEHKMITVFKKDGTPMIIDEGATVLDFAFAIDRNIGICAKYAHLNGSNAYTPIYQRLKPGDMVEVVSDHDKNRPADDIAHATVRWFEYLHTREATKALSRWLEKHMDSATPKMIVYDSFGKEYEIDMAATVLDFAFAISEEVGLHVQNAYINKSETPAELDKTLRYGDKVRFEYDAHDLETPVFTWLSIVKTKTAKDCLINYFNCKYH